MFQGFPLFLFSFQLAKQFSSTFNNDFISLKHIGQVKHGKFFEEFPQIHAQILSESFPC